MSTKAKGPAGLNDQQGPHPTRPTKVYNRQYIACGKRHPVVEVVTHQAVTR